MFQMHETSLRSTPGQFGPVSKNDDEEHCFLKSFGFRFRLVMFFRGTSIFAMLAGGETIGTINCGQVVGEYSE